MNQSQMDRCRDSFEELATSDGEKPVMDHNGEYKNVLHRSQWRKYCHAWTGGFASNEPSIRAQPAPRIEGDLLKFLASCRQSGVYFDGTDVLNQPGIYFVTTDQLKSLLPPEQQPSLR